MGQSTDATETPGAPETPGSPGSETRLGAGFTVRRIAGAGAAGVFVVAGALVATALGWPMPWSDSKPDYGVPREIPLTDPVGDEHSSEADEPAVPPHLMTDTPDHLGGDMIEEEPAAPGSTRASAPAGTSITTTSLPATTSTPTTTVPATTVPPVTTPTLPGAKQAASAGTPDAADDTYSIAASKVIRLWVLGNDSDPNGEITAVTMTLVSGPEHALRFSLDSDHFRYRSHSAASDEFSPEDSFVYEICDEEGLCDMATVTLFVQAG